MKKVAKDQSNKIAPDDAALFRATVGEVKPLAEQNRVKPQSRPRKPMQRTAVSAPAIPDTLSDHGAEDAPTEYLQNGLSRMALRKLRRGNLPVQDRLDLHGLRSDAARVLLLEFLHEAMQRELRCVLVIHGKGMNSPGGEAVLRKLARHWLTQHPGVMGYCEAPPNEGGTGAVLVLLRNL